MIKLYVSVLAVMACLASFAQDRIETTGTGGSWGASSTWYKNGAPSDRAPQSGDIITINSGATVTLSNDVTTTLSNVKLEIYGTLSLSSSNGKKTVLALTSSSINVYTGTPNGLITRGNNEDITVNAASIFTNGSVRNINAPFSSGTYIALPVKFTGFSVARQNSDVLVQWSTSEEVNAENYYVERSYDGANWTNVATVASQGNTSSLTHYSHLDKHVTAAIAYYRIKQVDMDGKFTYTAIRSVKSAGGALAVNVAAINNRVVLQFSAPVKGSVEVRLVSLAGQVVSKQIINNPVGQVVLNNSALKGSYIVTVSNAADINLARQVVL